MPIKYFVTRHNGAILWARDAGIRARKITQENFDVNIVNAGDVVMGTLPVHLAGEVLQRGGHYWHLSMEVPLDLRGKELTAEQMRKCNARLEEFRVLPRGIRSSASREVEVPSLAPEGGLIHVVIASEQVLPNLLPALVLPCAGIHILVSNCGAIRKSAALLGDIAREHFAGRKGFTVMEHKLGKGVAYADLLTHFIKAREAVRESTNGAPLMLNITGGTKPMALAAAEAFAGMASIAYLNAQTNQIECIEPAYCVPYPVSYEALSLPLYVQANGYDICQSPSASSPDLAEMESRQAFTGYLARNAGILSTEKLIRGCVDFSLDGKEWPFREERADIWQLRSTMLARLCEMGSAVDDQRSSKTAPAPLFVRWTLPKGGDCDLWRDLLKRMQREAIIEIIDLGWKPKADADPGCAIIDFRFKSAACARYVGGTWLEEFAALTAREVAFGAGLDPSATVHTGVRLSAKKTLGTAESKAEINEIDVAIYHGGRMLIIEAKAGGYSLLKNSQSVLNKLDRLKRSVAGPFGAAWLLSARSLDEEEESATVKDVTNLLHRARFYGIDCHAADDLPRFHEAIALWLKVPCPKAMAKVPPVWSKDDWLPRMELPRARKRG
jgi:CRISPR-associated protein Csx16